MSVNVEALIDCLGKTYQEIFDAGLIPYKKKPTGFSGDPDISLDMIKEGIYLSFNRVDKVLNEITLRIPVRKNKLTGIFPNELPAPLRKNMIPWLGAENIGFPEKEPSFPRKVLKERYWLYQILYDFKKI
uniref:Immunity protein n=1 Tax=Pectobacterium carotovorum subsp. carotovorum TaxID=555 RepID=Q2V059_PECCC|nr:immunity protein [Pectobacterium carotovorum subsp. carotovorum]